MLVRLLGGAGAGFSTYPRPQSASRADTSRGRKPASHWGGSIAVIWYLAHDVGKPLDPFCCSFGSRRLPVNPVRLPLTTSHLTSYQGDSGERRFA